MFFRAFAGIAIIPVEARDFGQVGHGVYIMNTYARMQVELANLAFPALLAQDNVRCCL